jgi:hypothetical protein
MILPMAGIYRLAGTGNDKRIIQLGQAMWLINPTLFNRHLMPNASTTMRRRKDRMAIMIMVGRFR